MKLPRYFHKFIPPGWIGFHHRRIKHLLQIWISFGFNYVKLCLYKLPSHRSNNKWVAISLTEHMGDIVASEPIVQHIRQLYPDGFVVWIVRPTHKDLVKYNPLVDRVITAGCFLEAEYWKRSHLFDTFVDLHISGRYCPKCLYTVNNSAGDNQITLKNYFDHGSLLPVFCLVAGLHPLDAQPKVHIPNSVSSRVKKRNLPIRYVVIHCTSNVSDKDWTTVNWQILVKDIIEKLNVDVVEVGLKSVVNSSAYGYYNLCGKASVLETAEIIKCAQLFIGIDSGPAHLANAVATPGVVLLGEFAGFSNYLPYSGNYAGDRLAKLIYGDGPAANISVREAYTAVEKMMTGIDVSVK